MSERATQPDLVLAAMMDGLNTVQEIAEELNLETSHARVVINRLAREGLVRFTGRVVAGSTARGTKPRIYELVEK